MADSAVDHRRRSLAYALVLSFALHGFALSPICWQGWADAQLAQFQAQAGRSSLFATLRPRELAPLPTLGATQAEVAPRDEALEFAPSIARFPEKTSREAPDDVRELIEPGTPNREPATAPDSSPKAAYLPRSALSSPAQPLREIMIPWPEGLPTMGLRSAVFTLFVDETGVVQDMVPDGHTLTPLMEEVAKRTFMATPFRPAWANGRPVKSMMRIEVFFEYSVRTGASGEAEVVERGVLK